MKKHYLLLLLTAAYVGLTAQTPFQRVYNTLNTKCQNSACHSATATDGSEILKFDGNIDAFKKIGISDIRPLTQQETRKVGVKGVKVVSIQKGSLIENKNMEIGFVITHINEKPVNSLDEAVKLISLTKGKVVLTGVYEDFPEEYYYTFVK